MDNARMPDPTPEEIELAKLEIHETGFYRKDGRKYVWYAPRHWHMPGDDDPVQPLRFKDDLDRGLFKSVDR